MSFSIFTQKTMWFILLCLFGVAASAQDPNPPSIRSTSGAWPIRRQWTPAETRHYAQWVENIYFKKTKGNVEQRMAKLDLILTDPEMNLLLDRSFLGEGSNPQLPGSVIRSMHHLMDCGKFTAFMPAYYAYRRALPWMTAVVSSGGGDIRTSTFNIPVNSVSSFSYGSVASFFGNAVGCFISGNYRVNLNGKNAHLSDTLPVAITREYLLPGCMNYIDGHCLVLAHVSEYGELHFLNCGTAHTRDVFSYNGMNTVSGITPTGSDPTDPLEGCFQGLRVLRYPIAITDASGRVTQVRRRTNEEMKEFGFSTEQFDIVREISRQQFIEVGQLKVQSVHDFIRLRMKTVDSVSPLAFMESYANEILDAYVARAQFVQDAWDNVRRGGAIVYPEEQRDENIFQALGRWETWSSPSSDVDRRNKYFYLADWLEYCIRLYGVIPEFVDLTGLEKYDIHSQADLAKAMMEEKKRIFAERSMEYRNTKGEPVRLTLLDIEERLYDLSFDPNHPPELRWGAPMGSEERASAPHMYTPVPTGQKIAMEDAYRWQAYYRSLCARETDVSCLREMFTTGYPVRDKLDAQLGKWLDVVATAPVDAVADTVPEPAPEPVEALTPPPAAPIVTEPVIESGTVVRRKGNSPAREMLPPKRALPQKQPVRPRNMFRRNY